MNLEDEIKQSSFPTDYHKVLINILYTHSSIANQITKNLKSYEITRQQYNILRILRGNTKSPYNIGDIKGRMLDKMSDVSRIIDRLSKKKLVEKINKDSDKRITEIFITEKGKELLTTIDPLIDQISLSYKENLSQEEVSALNSLLDKLRG